jgi:hypothetical protein
MDSLGINFGLLLVPALSGLIPLGWLVFSIVTIFAIKKRQLSETTQAVWVLISLIPFLGAIAFWLIQPGNSKSSN